LAPINAWSRLELLNERPSEEYSEVLYRNTIGLGSFDVFDAYDRVGKAKVTEWVARKRGFKLTIQLNDASEGLVKYLKIEIEYGCRVRVLKQSLLLIGGKLEQIEENVWVLRTLGDDEKINHTTLSFDEGVELK